MKQDECKNYWVAFQSLLKVMLQFEPPDFLYSARVISFSADGENIQGLPLSGIVESFAEVID